MKLADTTAGLLESLHEGHQIAYVASHYTAGVWRLSIVRDGESGHYPVSEDDAWMGTQEEANAEAHRLNRERLKLPIGFETAIICQSMRNR
jgi:hypothetical protein